MAREFSVSAGGLTVAGATTLLFINPAAAPNSNLEILRMWVGQSANASSAQQRIQVVTQVSAFPTGTSATPRPSKHADATISIIAGIGTEAVAGKCCVNASAEGAGTKTVKFEDAFNVLNGWLWVPTPRETVVMPAGSVSGLGIFFPVAPATLTGWSVGLVYAEV